ncbi:MAG: SMEK domain-containing protein [Halobacteriovoraceae bacterium]|nr:SMEK domain-containing protein [Halobacteriovoraceae bacterium]
MIQDRKQAFDTISRSLAITRYDIEQHQSVNDLSLNIHGENFFRDIFNDVYKLNLENTNFKSTNNACIDLIDNGKKLAYQITTTRTKEKIKNTLRALTTEKYKEFQIKIFYLLDRASPTENTIQEVRENYGINLTEILFDYENIIKDIQNLPNSEIVNLCNNHFKNIQEKYTDHITLDLTIKHLLRKWHEVKIDYDDSFGSIKAIEKIKLNNLNERNSTQVKLGLDYSPLLDNLEDGQITSELRSYIIGNLYKEILASEIAKKCSSDVTEFQTVEHLQAKAIQLCVDINKLIVKLHDAIGANIDIKDFNNLTIPWIIISYFFELCDVGIHKNDHAIKNN